MQVKGKLGKGSEKQGVTVRCTRSAFGKGGGGSGGGWGGCLQREKVSQAVVDEGESKAGEQFSAPESFIREQQQPPWTDQDES